MAAKILSTFFADVGRMFQEKSDKDCLPCLKVLTVLSKHGLLSIVGNGMNVLVVTFSLLDIAAVIDICSSSTRQEVFHAIYELFASCFTGKFVEEDCVKSLLNGDIVRKIVQGLHDGNAHAQLSRYFFNYITFIRECETGAKSEVVVARLKENHLWIVFWKIMDKHVESLSKREKNNPTAHFNREVIRSLKSLLKEGTGSDFYKHNARSGFTPALTYSEFLWLTPHYAKWGARRLCELLDRSCEFIYSNSKPAFDEVATFFSQYSIEKSNIQFEVILFSRIIQKFIVCLFTFLCFCLLLGYSR